VSGRPRRDKALGDTPLRDKPWIFRTYAGHSTAAASNALYRKNLNKGQTGLSVAFDLPTQTGYDSDHPHAKGEVGKAGVPISHIGDMRALFDGIPLGEMNTSMTINATAAWLLALYAALADEQGVARKKLTGTTQNDIIKEYLSRGTYVFPPAPSMRLTKDVILFTTKEMPKWNPMNVCSYHLQEAGATPVQELAFALATAIGVLDAVKTSSECAPEEFGEVVGRISFFVNAGLRFVTEVCKMRAFTELWDEITRERSEAAAVPLRRAGQFARADRAAAREQRRAHPDRDAGGHAVQTSTGAGGATSGLERGARAAAAVGSAMVAAHAANPRLRDRPA
jgi:ethylmalonyl-CoA mutase